MRISKISASNIKNFKTFSLDCGDVNIFSGRNAEGKTSGLCLVTGLLGKGNPRMLRPGADSGHIAATIEGDNGESWEITRTFEPGKVKTPQVYSSETGKIGASVDFLESIVNMVSLDPISRAMQADEKQQIQILLETMPLRLEDGEIEKPVVGLGKDIPGLAAHVKNAARMPSGLDAIKAIHDAIYDHRRDVNRDARTKATHASELRDSIPENALTVDWSVTAANLTSDLEREQKAEQAERDSCARDMDVHKGQVRQWQTSAEQDVDDDINRRMRELEKERRDRKQVSADQAQAQLEEAAITYREHMDGVSAKYRAEIERLKSEHAVADKNSREQAGHRKTEQIADENARQAAILEDKSKAMTAALQALDALKECLLARLPIKGLSIESGVISLDGMPLSEYNTAERAKFWLRVCAMRAGELGVCVMDGFEIFDQKNLTAVIKGMKQSGLQWFIGYRNEEDFNVKCIDVDVEEAVCA